MPAPRAVDRAVQAAEIDGIVRSTFSAGVHTGGIGRALRALQAGTVWVNRYGRTADFILSTGGYKQSGIGKDLGRQAYEGCLRYKATLVDFSA